MKKIACILFAITALSGCVNRIGDFTVASTKNIDIKDTKFISEPE